MAIQVARASLAAMAERVNLVILEGLAFLATLVAPDCLEPTVSKEFRVRMARSFLGNLASLVG